MARGQPAPAVAAGIAAAQAVQFVVITLISVAVGSRSSAVGWISYASLALVPGVIARAVARRGIMVQRA